MNEPASHLNERDPEDMEVMLRNTKKELKVNTYTNKVHLSFLWLDHRNSKVKRT